MADSASEIPVRVEVNEDDRSVIILIPWERLGRVNAEECREWFRRAELVKQEWQAKGYRCN